MTGSSVFVFCCTRWTRGFTQDKKKDSIKKQSIKKQNKDLIPLCILLCQLIFKMRKTPNINKGFIYLFIYFYMNSLIIDLIWKQNLILKVKWFLFVSFFLICKFSWSEI